MESGKNKNHNRESLKLSIIKTAERAFIENGIRSVRMDDIAASLSISKRTLYELFSDKQKLLLEVVQYHHEIMERKMVEAIKNKANVIEILFQFYEIVTKDFQKTNRVFFQDLEKYPDVVAFVQNQRKQDANRSMDFYMKGVEQGIFRDDVNYTIVRALMSEHLFYMFTSDVLSDFSLVEIFENVFFMHMRGVSTPCGQKLVNQYLSEFKLKNK